MPLTAGSSTAEPGPSHPVFYLDLASPEAYLSAERVLQVMPVATEWIPVHLGAPAAVDWAAIERIAAARGMQAVRRPAAFPFDAGYANRAATYAKQIGRTVAFAQAAFRQAYAGGRDLSVPDNVLIAGSACEMHPAAILKSASTRLVATALERATALAVARGVRRAPAVWAPGAGPDAPGHLFSGDAALEDAAAALAERVP